MTNFNNMDQDLIEFEEPKLANENTTESIPLGTIEDTNEPPERGVLKWVYDPENIFQNFELFLRGIRIDRMTGEHRQLYKGYYMEQYEEENEEGEIIIKEKKVLIPYKLMNDRGINDCMSVFTMYVNKVTSFSRYSSAEIDAVAGDLLILAIERYMLFKAREFEIEPADGYLISFLLYDLVRSGWRQSMGGTSLNMLGRTQKTTEIISQGGNQGKKPKWQFW